MKRPLIFSAAICALLGSAIFAFADIARPKPSPAEPKTVFYTGLTIVPDAQTGRARLQISQTALERLKNASANSGGTPSVVQNVMHSSTRTVMAGLFMFLAVSFAGVWLARSGQRRNQKAMAAVILIATVFGLATAMVRANAGPPGYVYLQNLPTKLTNGQSTQAGVNIEIVPGDDSTIKLIVPMRNTNRPGEKRDAGGRPAYRTPDHPSAQ